MSLDVPDSSLEAQSDLVGLKVKVDYNGVARKALFMRGLANLVRGYTRAQTMYYGESVEEWMVLSSCIRADRGQVILGLRQALEQLKDGYCADGYRFQYEIIEDDSRFII